ncbi:NUDIX hydrolase domain-like protein [Massariosphaeria phaeospora]|uniref:NUDIX hydrolase domain-like protein n=1 Tax=Massariosphaeria phaeospora TaxID=100035 RepID=A0A7C8ILU4_9PLEO|nr:NUDIX hydrolase domain-like protein [Massariosphaeria phaeospora]
MLRSEAPFDYPPSLQMYMVSGKQFVQQNPRYHVVCTGIVVFNDVGKLLLVRRAANEKAYPNMWEIPGGMVDDTDETIIHGAIRELKEETGLTATKVVRKVGEMEFTSDKKDGSEVRWIKHIFEMEFEDIDALVLDPVEHQQHLFATEDEIGSDRVGDIELKYISPPNKVIKLDAFRSRNKPVSTSVNGIQVV